MQPRPACSAIVLAAVIGLPAAGMAQPIAPMASHERGRVLYVEACANCHGPDGRGASISSVVFEEPLPDFTDCSFATREPDPDWMAVAHDGGPARAFSPIMPAYGSALSEAQLQDILDYMRTLCASRAWPRGELNLPRPLVTEKAFPEDEAVFTSAIAIGDAGAVANKLVYERRFGARNQVEVIVPFGFAEGPDAWQGGIGDVAVGAKRAVYHDFRRGTIFSVAGEIVLPTGDESRGLGKGTVVFEPFVAFGQVRPQRCWLKLLPATSRQKASWPAFAVSAGNSTPACAWTNPSAGRT